MSYPIWVEINSCAYKSNKSYGIKEHGTQTIYVGSSKKNSKKLGEVLITRGLKQEFRGFLNVIVFEYSFDGIILKKMIFENNNEKAGKLLKTITMEQDNKENECVQKS